MHLSTKSCHFFSPQWCLLTHVSSLSIHTEVTALDLIPIRETTGGYPPISSYLSFFGNTPTFELDVWWAGVKTMAPSPPFLTAWLHAGQWVTTVMVCTTSGKCPKGGMWDWPPCFLPSCWLEWEHPGWMPSSHIEPWPTTDMEATLCDKARHRSIGPWPHSHFGLTASRLLECKTEINFFL